MRFPLILTAVVLVLLSAVPRLGIAAGTSSNVTAERVEGLTKPIDPTMPLYKPRKGSTLRGRVDGGFRGREEGEPVVKVLVPADHVGETIKTSPSLYWYLSSLTTFPITFTLENRQLVKPVLEVPLKSPTCPGVQMIRLTDYNKSLDEAVQYQWHISVIVDPDSRSKDIHAAGYIERVPYPQALIEGRVSQCRDPLNAVCLYAEAGLWYDAIMVISDLILGHPKDRVLRLIRASLLEQVGLTDVAEYDRMQNGTPCPPSKVELKSPEPTSSAATVRP